MIANHKSRVTTDQIEVASLDDLRSAIEPVRVQLLSHPLYLTVNTLPGLRVFMAYHVFAVWDFMCLAKRLQRDLTSLNELWLPPLRPSLARFINSVVHEEESDIDANGQAASHFGLYLSAMKEVGASTAQAEQFIALLRMGEDAAQSLADVGAPESVKQFVSHTLKTVKQGTTVEVLASFLFGREDLIPEMFSHFLPRWDSSRDALGFTYYVKRHIELDSDEHGPAGFRALAELVGGDISLWEAARQSAHNAILARIALWDSVQVNLTNS
jgi:Protein of unknown function (DUF3050)